MKKYAFIAVGLLYSVGAFSADFDFSILGHSEMRAGRLHRCLKDGWKASSPTDAQNTQAKAILESARTTLSTQKDVFKKDKEDLMTAWAASPIVAQDVEKAEAKLRTDMQPVRSAIRGDVINILNLLSADQKKEFNTSFMSCMKKSHRAVPTTGTPSTPNTSTPNTSTPNPSQPSAGELDPEFD